MSITTAPNYSLKVTRLIKAPRERVFEVWTMPSEIKNWLCHVTSAKIDLRVGGKYHFVASGGECGNTGIQGEYREINPPSRLVFTWSFLGNDGMKGEDETLVTVDFIDRNGATEVQISHDLFQNQETCDKHSEGWNACLDKLEKLV